MEATAIRWQYRSNGLLPFTISADEAARIKYRSYFDWHRSETEFMFFLMFRDQQPIPRPWPDLPPKLHAVRFQGKVSRYDYGDWSIESVGGLCTMKHWHVTRLDDSYWFWTWTRKEAVELLNQLFDGMPFEAIPEMYRRPLYT